MCFWPLRFKFDIDMTCAEQNVRRKQNRCFKSSLRKFQSHVIEVMQTKLPFSLSSPTLKNDFNSLNDFMFDFSIIGVNILRISQVLAYDIATIVVSQSNP